MNRPLPSSSHRIAVRVVWCLVLSPLFVCLAVALVRAGHVAELQRTSREADRVWWGHWGPTPGKYSTWKSHSNRLIPIYTFGVRLDAYTGANSVYRDASRLAALYGFEPVNTHNSQAEYCDQTDVYRLQRAAAAAGKKYIVLIVFDGMDWQTTQAAAIVRSGAVGYREGRGTGLWFQDYDGTVRDFGFCVTSPHNEGTKVDVDAQVITQLGDLRGGYDWRRGGSTPWQTGVDLSYLISKSGNPAHAYADSSASATALTAGVKIYNDGVNIDIHGKPVQTIAHQLQAEGRSIGVVTSVPISHATPACAYAHNVHRDDYQDLTRDLLGLRSISHRSDPLPGVDVLIGCGWGEDSRKDSPQRQKKDMEGQGRNFVPGNRYLTDEDLKAIDVANGGRYVVAQRTPRRSGSEVLAAAAQQAKANRQRLFGFFGARRGHLPFRTANGDFKPVAGASDAETYSKADIHENPTLADMARAALDVLSTNEKGFWLMVEAGDVDWANHDNNLDASIGAVHSGDDAFRAVTQWVESRNAWDETAVILTADHGHLLVLDHPEVLLGAQQAAGK